MLRQRIAAAAFGLLTLVGVALAGAPGAFADGGGNDCPPGSSDWECHGTGTPGGPGNGGGGGGGGGGGDKDPAVCTVNGVEIPCTYEGAWFYSPMGCYIAPATPTPGDPAVPPPGDPTKGGYFAIRKCPGDAGDTGLVGHIMWLPIAPNTPTLTPEQLARRALAKIRLLKPPMHISPGPGKTGLVTLPVWLWTEPGPNTWGPISATDTDATLSVTISATVSKIVWNMGDGTSVTCTTPGTEYTPAAGDSASPDCGHIYRKTSKGMPGDAFTVTATATWTVSWTSNSPADPAGSYTVTRTNSVGDVKVGELQVLTSG